MPFSYQLKNDGKMIVNDPIYGDITIEPPFTQIILTKEMKRLENISQNGFSLYDYPGLKDNERLSHSVGTFHIMSEIINHLEKELKRYDIELSKDEKDMALCSMLLHDIGHGPFSHTGEKVMGYSHEVRTTDILLGDTEINHLLKSIYGPEKLKKIARYIAEIDEDESTVSKEKTGFTKLLKSLISHQLDADRLDYLVRDSHYANILSAIDYKALINSLGISVNNNKEYELIVDKKGLTNIETILIERFQRYRDVYRTRSALILESVFGKIIEIYRDSPEEYDSELPESFKRFALNPKNLSLKEFLSMNDNIFFEAFQLIRQKSQKPLLKYLCDMPKVLSDFQDIRDDIDPEVIKKKLSEIFQGHDFSNTLSIVSDKFKIKLYKTEESLLVNMGSSCKDLSEASHNLIRPDEYLEKKIISFNPEIVRLELGLSEKEFEKYKEKLNDMLGELNKKPEEFELKYILKDNLEISEDEVLNVLLSNGFSIKELKNKQNDDEYYDTKDLYFLKRGGSLRIRRLTQDGKEGYKATYKMPTTKGEVYSSREEIELELENNSIEELKRKMRERGINEGLDDVYSKPIINAKTKRRDVILEKNGVQVCLSFDNTKYTNHITNKESNDSMIEIEALGDIGNRVILNEIDKIMCLNFQGIERNKQSKYERGIKKTRRRSQPDAPDVPDSQQREEDRDRI